MPELLASDGTVFVCEGEKDADAVAALGLVATCNPMGAGKWSVVADLARTVLADRDVIVIADRDEAGRKHAADVREALADVAHSVIVSEVAKGKDAADWIAAGAVAGDFMRLEPVAIVTDSPFITIGPPEIFAPLPPVPYLIEAMGLTPGAPTLWCGYGFSMKTLSAQACGLAVAIGRPVFGVYHPKRMPVLHLDYEQGERLTRERYIRLARGLGIDPRELEPNWLRLCALPSFYLDNASAADALARAMDGCGLVIVDSLRASAPMLEENSSAFRNCLDALTRASEKTGAAPFVVHHSRKPSGDDTGGAKMSIRGSSAIFDACAGVFVLAAEKGKPVRVQHEKDRNRGLLMPDFGLRAEDVETAGDPRHGLRIVHLEPEQMASSKTEKEAKSAEHKRAQLLDAATACARIVSETPNIGTKDLRAKLAAALGGCSHDRVDDAVAMCGSAITTRTGKRGTKHHTIDLSTLPLEILTRVGAVGKP
ncbi:MAG TPA: AAA family ATPase [Polyangiaceae bacterium]